MSILKKSSYETYFRVYNQNCTMSNLIDSRDLDINLDLAKPHYESTCDFRNLV